MSTKNTPKQSNKSSKHKEGFKRFIPKTKLGWFFVVCGIVVIGLTIYSIIVINNRPKILTKDQAKEFLQKQDTSINLPGTLVYKKITDNGCQSLGLFQGEYCTYSLKKYYKNSGSKEADIKDAEDALVRGGCVKATDYKSANNMSYDFDVPNEEGFAYCAINIFSLDNKGTHDSAKAFFGIDQDIPLQDGEYAYDINITREYKYDPNTQ